MNSQEIIIPASITSLYGELTIPPRVEAMVIFVHGSGSSRKSIRNRTVAQRLNKQNIGTLLFDLLTEEEDKDYTKRFDIELLTGRLVNTTQWLAARPETAGLNMGYFGASTGAAAALEAAARLPDIKAIVSRGGRPDMAMDALHNVHAPVLLIVGSRDGEVLELNKAAFANLNCEKKFTIIEGATHLFEEPGALDKVANEAGAWFHWHLAETKKHLYV